MSSPGVALVASGEVAVPTVRPAARVLPWRSSEVFALVAVQCVCLTLFVVAWLGAADRVTLGEQLGFVYLGVGALSLSGLGNAWFLYRGARRIRTRIRVVIHRERARRSRTTSSDTAVVVVVGRTVSRYHRPGCVLVRGKTVDAVDPTATELLPCEVCRP